ncbi:MAG: 3-phosphoshikimate 1-carboxyvinyltransferase [Chloroflexota bacterium]|nr:MAG: 3-phosphoshikimate 1-carboxyvinyltransferase [Chloroflexota bacterium]
MNLTVHPGHALRGELVLPGDKSLSHRAALFGALAEGKSVIENFLVSGVTAAMLDCLDALGVTWAIKEGALYVDSPGWQALPAPGRALNCGNSATTLRLMAGALAAAGVPAVLDGSPGLRKRPMGRILEPLIQMGVPVESAEGGCAPIRLGQRSLHQPLTAIEYTLPVASAQVKSCLLLAALAAGGPVTLHEPGLSRDHTERMLAHMGVVVRRYSLPGRPGPSVTLTPPTRPLRPLRMRLPGDFSSAAFLIVAALITPGSDVWLREAGLNPTRTGMLDVLQEMGANIQVVSKGERAGEPVGDLHIRYAPLQAGSVSGDRVVRMIDEFPAFAVAACFAEGLTQVKDAAELRYKESDRIAWLCAELKGLGADMSESPDGFAIRGGSGLRGGRVDPHGDHRLAMALAVAGLAAGEPVLVQGAEIMAESFPEFGEVLQSLGAEMTLEAVPDEA